MVDRDTVFAQLIDLAPVGPGRFVGSPSPEPRGRTFGGHFLAQSLAAAQLAGVADRVVHSLHAYFVRAGDVDEPTTYDVAAMRDGRSFALRSVTASQQGELVFQLTASFHSPEAGFDYQPGQRFGVRSLIESVPPPNESMMTYTQFTYQHPHTEPGSWDGDKRPIEILYINPPSEAEGVAVVEPQLMWLRLSGAVPEDPAAHTAGLAYLSDSTLIDHVMLPHGYRWQDRRLTGTSLDHAMWFHRPARVDQWLLFDQRVELTGGARGLVAGRLYSSDGTLVATCYQEGLMRWDAMG